MRSSIRSPRKSLALCSPSAQRMASETLLCPQPLGPTTPVTPGSNDRSTLSAKDLKPKREILVSCISKHPPPEGESSDPRMEIFQTLSRAGRRCQDQIQSVGPKIREPYEML